MSSITEITDKMLRFLFFFFVGFFGSGLFILSVNLSFNIYWSLDGLDYFGDYEKKHKEKYYWCSGRNVEKIGEDQSHNTT